MSKLFTAFGVLTLLFGIYLLWLHVRPISAAPEIATEDHTVMPIVLDYPELSLHLPIRTTSMKNGNWELSSDGVSYLVQSVKPGEIGTSVIYGHNWTNLLGPLQRSKPGQLFSVSMNNGASVTFSVVRTYTVNANETHILIPSTQRKLTVYTCAGLFDTKRFVVEALAVK